jgi:general secretion pathway protein M
MSPAFDSFRDWWTTRTERERWMLIGLGALLAALLFWYGLLQPLERLAADAQDHQAEAAAALSEAETLKAGIDAAEAGLGRASAAQVAEIARATATQAQIGLAREEAGTEGALELWTEPVTAKALFAWLADLQQKGVGVRTLETHRGEEGLIDARLALVGGAP